MEGGLNSKEVETLRAVRLGKNYLDTALTEWDRLDVNLVRWLRARDLNVDKAERLLKDAMDWRRDNDIDKIGSWRKPSWMESGFKFYAPGVDKDGNVVSIIVLRTWLPDGGFNDGRSKESVVRFANQVFEQGINFMKKQSKDRNHICNQINIVFDFEGYPLSRLVSKDMVDVMMECLRIFEANYPETLKACYVINAPVIFEILYNLLKPFVTARTLEKLQVFGCKPEAWRSALLKNIEPEELPSNYGGSNTSCKYYDFNDGIDRLPALPDLSLEDFNVVTIKAGDKTSVECFVEKPHTKLIWNFRTENYDIGFRFLRESQQIFACDRADSHLHVQRGTYVCEIPGLYKFEFDNSFSKFRSKVVQYAVRLEAKCEIVPTNRIEQLG